MNIKYERLKSQISDKIELLSVKTHNESIRLTLNDRDEIRALLMDYHNLIVAMAEEESLVDAAVATLPPTMAGYNRLVSGLAKEGDMRRRIINHYFKDDGSHREYMSGLPLPVQEDGKVHDIDFTNCDFHSCCKQVTFVNCTFTDCSGSEDLPKEDVKSDGV